MRLRQLPFILGSQVSNKTTGRASDETKKTILEGIRSKSKA